MGDLQLTRHSAQLELLAEACQCRQPARLVLCRGNFAGDSALLALERSGVVLAWPCEGLSAAAADGASAEVFFVHRDEHFAFVSETAGRNRRWFDHVGHVDTLKVAVPLCVERREQRLHARLTLDHVEIEAGVTNVRTRETRFTMTLTNLSRGGVGGRAATTLGAHLRAGDAYWIDFTLPDDLRRLEFIARLEHVREMGNGWLYVGWAFCPADDADAHADNLRQLEQFMIRRQAVSVAPPGPGGPGGVHQ